MSATSAFSKAAASPILTADGRCRMLLDSVAEAERAAGEAANVETKLVARDLAQAVAPSLEPFANQRLAAAPPHLMPAWLSAKATPLAHRRRRRAPRPADDGKIAAPRSTRCAALRRWPTRATPISAKRPGRAAQQYEIVAEVEALAAAAWLARQFHDHRLGRRRRARHGAAIGTPAKGRRSRHHRTHALRRRIFLADLPHAGARQGERHAEEGLQRLSRGDGSRHRRR